MKRRYDATYHREWKRRWRAKRQAEIAVDRELGRVTLRACQTCKKEVPQTEMNAPEYVRCRPCDNARNRKCRAANPTPSRLSTKRWQSANAEKRKAYAREYERKNQDKKRARHKRWQQRHLTYCAEKNRAAYAANPLKTYVRRWRYRARVAKAQGYATLKEIQARVEMFGSKCWVCRAPYTAIDHVKPISKGGSNWPANLRPICGPCNSRKHNHWPVPELMRAA